MSPTSSPYWSLVKPRIVALLCLTGVTSLVAAGGERPLRLVGFLIAGACIAGGSAALNCVYDRTLDRRMERTAARPLPSGELGRGRALAFAVGLLVVGTTVGALTVPAVAVAYMWLGVAAYVGLYTVALKRRHWLGVVLGGSAGSFPVLAGWTAVRPLTVEPFLFAALVFLWTPAHAWALAFVYRDDFAAAGVPTLPVVVARPRVQQAVWVATVSTVLLAAVVAWAAPAPTGVALAVAGGAFLTTARRFRVEGTEATAVRHFFASNTFLAFGFVAWAASALLGPVSLAESAFVAALTALAFVGMWLARPSLRGVPAATGAEARLGDLCRTVVGVSGVDAPRRGED